MTSRRCWRWCGDSQNRTNAKTLNQPWGLLVHAGTLSADGVGLTAVTLIGRDEPDSAVAVLGVVPVHECLHPGAGVVLAPEWPPWVVRTVLDRAEQRFRVGVKFRTRSRLIGMSSLAR